MSEIRECPKYYGKMVGGSEQTLDDAFGCTRGGIEGPKRLEKYNFNIQPYICENCGYMISQEEGISHE